jgi:hypothetical protein
MNTQFQLQTCDQNQTKMTAVNPANTARLDQRFSLP